MLLHIYIYNICYILYNATLNNYYLITSVFILYRLFYYLELYSNNYTKIISTRNQIKTFLIII